MSSETHCSTLPRMHTNSNIIIDLYQLESALGVRHPIVGGVGLMAATIVVLQTALSERHTER